MNELIKVQAKLELFSGENMRKTSFKTGYRPLFDFGGAKTKISGKIDLIAMDNFVPGKINIVQITFIKGILDDKYFSKGNTFTISEGIGSLGKGEIIKILF